jgi:hypothetical protein
MTSILVSKSGARAENGGKEREIIDTAPTFDRGRPNRWQRLMFKAPIALSRDGPAELMRSRCVMVLTTNGRRCGLPRTAGTSFMPHDEHFIVFADWGVG